jgi:zinc transport system permease protein
MIELFNIPFVQNAIIGGITLAVLLSVLSLFITIKNWSFINVGISHAAFGGLAIGFYFGLNPTLIGGIFAIIVGLLIGYISKQGKLHEDVSIGILFSFSMAIGVIIISMAPNYNTDLFTFLFGNILTITKEDIYILFSFTVFTLIFLYIFFQKIMFCCWDEDVAYTSGINTSFYYYSLITIVAVATVLSVKLVGVILASAMMILPSAFASQFFWHYKKIIVSSIIFSILMVLAGIYISYERDMPAGATIVALYSSVFGVVLIFKSFWKTFKS